MKIFIGITLAALTIVALTGCGGDRTGGTYQFTFEPPDSISFTVEFASRRIVSRGDSVITDSSWSRTPQTIRVSGSRYEVSRLTDSMVQYRKGEIVQDPILTMFASTPITMVIDSTGRVYDVIGYDKLFANLDNLLGSDTAAMLRSVVNPLQLKEQEATAWNDRFLPYVGREVTLGVPVCDTTPTNLPIEGPVDLYQITELADTVRLDGRLCGRMLITSSTDPKQLAELSGHTVEEVVNLFGITEEVMTALEGRQAGSSSSREWIMEFETMLTRSEIAEYKIFFNELDSSGTAVIQSMEETQHKFYTYPSL